MKNFAAIKPLRDCTPDELSVGTCFELTLDNIPSRRGVILKIVETRPMAWFVLKSSSDTDLFDMRHDFAPLDADRLWMRPVPRFEEFLRRVPGNVKARAGGVMIKSRRSKKANVFTDDHMHVDLLPTMPVPVEPGPGCSPPLTPQLDGRSERKKRTPMTPKASIKSEVSHLTASVKDMQATLTDIYSEVRKVKKIVKRAFTEELSSPTPLGPSVAHEMPKKKKKRMPLCAYEASPWT